MTRVILLSALTLASVGCGRHAKVEEPKAMAVIPAGTTGTLTEDCPLDAQSHQTRPCKMKFDANAKVEIRPFPDSTTR